MRFFIVPLILGSLVILTRSRPSRLVEENDSITGHAEYEGGDDNAADDYVRDDEESRIEEAQKRTGRQESVLQDAREEDGVMTSDLQSARDKDRYETFSENDSGSRKERQQHEIGDLHRQGERYWSDNEHSKKSQQIDDADGLAYNQFYSRPNNKIKRPPGDSSLNERPMNSDTDYGELLFKMKSAQDISGKQQNNAAEVANDQYSINKQYYNNNMNSRNRNPISEIRFENTYSYDRDRRHISNNEKQISDVSSTPNDKEDIANESIENAIIRNIKKLSEQDLEGLLNSLPEDKKALLKKIMDKREITKKAGAIHEDSYMEGVQSDTSKIEGGYSVDSNTESSSDTPEASKQPENGEVINSKTSDSENGSGGAGSKSNIINNTIMKNDKPAVREEYSHADPKNEININTNSEEVSNNGNKRETNVKDLTDEKVPVEDLKISDYSLDAKSSNDFLISQDSSNENENWFDIRNNEPQESSVQVETYKREISKKDPSVLYDSVKSLEESFPADNNLESEMAPLIRVKRTEKDRIKSRDASIVSKVHFSPDVDGKDCGNEEKSVFKRSAVQRNDQEFSSSKISGNTDAQRHSQLNEKSSELRPAILTGIQNTKFDKLSLGSDTDSILSGIKGVDDNVMYNSELRGKRIPESSYGNTNLINSSRIGRTIGPINIDDVSDNSINVSQYEENEAFGPLSRNSEDDINRIKRVKQIK